MFSHPRPRAFYHADYVDRTAKSPGSAGWDKVDGAPVLQPLQKADPRCDGVVELHQNDEPDAPIGVEDAQRRAQRVKRLAYVDAADYGFGDRFRRFLF